MNTRSLYQIKGLSGGNVNKITNQPVLTGFIPKIAMKKKALMFIVMLLCSFGLFAQADGPVTTAPEVVVSVSTPTTVDVEVKVSDFVQVGSFSLTMNFDPAVLAFISATPNPVLDPLQGGVGLFSPPIATTGQVSFGWFSSTAIASLPDETVLFTAHFTYSGGTSLLTWYDPAADPGKCEYTDELANIYNDLPYDDFYINGFVTDLAATATYTNKCDPGNVGVIEITATGGTGMYQYSIDGGATWHHDATYGTPFQFTNLAPGAYEILVSDVVATIPIATISAGFVVLPVHNVTQNTYYCEIQAAVDDADPNDLIHASAWTYNESVIIDKTLTIVGNPAYPDSVIINGPGTGVVVTITADNVIFNGFTVQNGGTTDPDTEAGILLFNPTANITGVAVMNSVVHNCATGIGVVRGTANTIHNNLIKDVLYGIGIAKLTETLPSTNNIITENEIYDVAVGIYVDKYCAGNQIAMNNLYDYSNNGIYLWATQNNIVNNNLIGGNATVVPGSVGLELSYSSGNIITGNTIENNDIGVDIRKRIYGGNTIQDNLIFNNNLFGMRFHDFEGGALTPVNNEVVDATLNWWGDPTGPFHPVNNTCGLGNAVSDYILFSPWYDDAGLATTASLPIQNITKNTLYCEIQDAVDDANDGDEIHFLQAGNFGTLLFNHNIDITINNVSSGVVTMIGGTALTVVNGDLSIDGVDFITADDVPTVDISGGKLTLRNCNVWESTAYNQTGVVISGGELDAGTSDTDPGHNRFLSDGTGLSMNNTGGIVNAINNHWGSDFYMVIFPKIGGNVPFDPWCNWDFTVCYLSRYNGPITYAPEKYATPGAVSIPVTVDRFANVDAISLTLLFDPAIIQYTGFAPNGDLGSMSVLVDNVNGIAKIGWYDLPVGFLPDGDTVVDLFFDYFGGTSLLIWEDSNAIDCEYQNALIQYPYIDTPQGDFYYDGWITDLGGNSTVSSTNVVCKGTQSGTISITPSGGSGSYMYSVDGGASWHPDPLFYVYAGTYQVMIQDSLYPQVTTELNMNLVIDEPLTPLAATANWTKKVRCKGESNGQATVYPTGGWGGYTYLWSDPAGQTTPVAVGLAAGMYTVTVTDVGGCEFVATAFVIEPVNAFTANAFESKVVTCKGGNDGALTVNAAHGWGYYMYSINNITYHNYLTSNVLSGLSAGNYTVHIFDDEGCELYLPVTITEPAIALAVTAVESEQVKCYGGSDGEITATPVGGWGGYTFSIDGGLTWQTSPVFAGLTAGVYTIEVMDSVGCVESTPVTVTEPDQLTANISGTTDICLGGNTDITFDVAGGVLPWNITYTDGTNTYNVPNFTTSPLVINVAPTATTTYDILAITDANGCIGIITGSAVITVNPLPEIGFSFKGLAATGSVFNYCYDEVVDVTLSHVWVGSEPFYIEWTVDDGTGPVTHYAYNVYLSDTLFSGLLPVGTHTVQITNITDANGCSPVDYTPYTATVIVNEEPMISFGFNGVEAGHNAQFAYCYDVPVEVTLYGIYGGTAPYDVTYTVNGGTPITVTGLSVGGIIAASQLYAPGVYNIVVTNIKDANGCEASATFLALCTAEITIHEEPMISFGFNGVEAGHNAQFAYCYNEPVEVTLYGIYGGTAPYDVTYTVNGGTPITVTGLSVGGVISASQIYAPGVYNIVVTNITDANGCEASASFLSLCTAEITINEEPMISFGFNGVEAGHNAQFAFCYNEPVEVTLYGIYGGTAPYDVTYTVNGGTPVTVTGVSLGGVISAAQLYTPGVYNIVVTNITDANGCEASQSFLALCTAEITINEEPMISFGFNGVEAGHNAVFAYCYNEPVEVTLYGIYGGTAPYDVTYTVNGGTPITVTGLNVGGVIAASQLYAPGVYNIVVTNITDANGCEASASFLALCTAEITIHEEPMISFGFNGVEAGHNAQFAYCYNEPVEVTLFGIYGGTAPYDVTYTINGGNPVTVTGLTVGSIISASQLYAPGVYNIVVTNITDANGCEASQSFLALCTAEITINEEPALGFSFNGNLAGTGSVFDFCFSDVVTVELSHIWGGTAPFDISWSVDDGTGPVTYNLPAVNINGQLFSGLLAPGTYTIQITSITDANGCSPDDYTPYVAVVNIHSYEVSGYYNYPNVFLTPLNNISVELTQSSNTIYSATTDANGYYEFLNVCPGTYEVVSTTIKPAGGINATDAVQVNGWSTSGPNYPLIEKVTFLAGDVVYSNTLTSADAGRILQYFVTSGNPPFNNVEPWSFWKANDQIGVNNFSDGAYPTITVGTSSLIQDFYGLVTGDFNHSFIPGSAKSGGAVQLNNSSSIPVNGQTEIKLPITVEAGMNVTAVSLLLNYPADKLEVTGVTLGNDANNSVMFHAQNGELRIGWHSLMPQMLNAGDVLVTLNVKPLPALTSGEYAMFTLVQSQLNEIAGSDLQVIPNALLNIASVEGTVGVNELPGITTLAFRNYPNPFNHNTTFNYYLPADGKVTLEIFDVTGRRVDMLLNQQMQSAGEHSMVLDNSLLGSGTYFANLTFSSQSGTVNRTIRIVSQK